MWSNANSVFSGLFPKFQFRTISERQFHRENKAENLEEMKNFGDVPFITASHVIEASNRKIERKAPSNFDSTNSESYLKNASDMAIDFTQRYFNCPRILHLKKFHHYYSDTNKQVLFTHTSPDHKLMGRQLCAIESAARISGLPVKVISTAKFLRTSEYSGLCEVLTALGSKVQFFSINLDELFENTPLKHALEKFRKLSPKEFLGNWLSDLMRYALIYKYGGFYADLDVIFLKDLTKFKNTFAINAYYPNPPKNCTIPDHAEVFKMEVFPFPTVEKKHLNVMYAPLPVSRCPAGSAD